MARRANKSVPPIEAEPPRVAARAEEAELGTVNLASLALAGLYVPVLTIVLAVGVHCTTAPARGWAREHQPCSIKWPLISDASARGPAKQIFALGMTLTGVVIAVASWMFYLWARVWICRSGWARAWNGLALALSWLSAASLAALSTVSMLDDDPLHVAFTASYFVCACAWVVTLQVIRIVWIRALPLAPAWVRVQRGAATALCALIPLLGAMHARVIPLSLAGVPQLGYALVEFACVLCTVLHPVGFAMSVSPLGVSLRVVASAPVRA